MDRITTRRKFVLIAWLSIHTLLAQNQLTRTNNLLRAGDMVVKQQLGFIDPGLSGKNIEWDFSDVRMVDDKYHLSYFLPDEHVKDTVIGLEHETRYFYKLSSDTLSLTGYTNRTTQMTYDKPEVLYVFPLKYGDSIRTDFSGTGAYCQTVELKAEGYSQAVADAYGKLKTPDNGMLDVIRILRTKEFADIGLDNTRMLMKTYQWFTPGCRYPVFETIRSFTLRNDSTIENFSTSFYFSEIGREELNLADSVNANVLAADSARSVDLLVGCTTYPNPVSSLLTVNYQLKADANVSFLVCDSKGLPWISVPAISLQAGDRLQKINMSGLPAGYYVLHIRVNGKAYARTILKI
jgi:Secretion system C-terminal sorting domain